MVKQTSRGHPVPGPGKSGRRAEGQARSGEGRVGSRQLPDQLLPIRGQAAGADPGASLWPCSGGVAG